VKLKFRKLERSFDWQSFDAVRRDEMAGQRKTLARMAAGTLVAAVDAPVQVEAEDFEATLEEAAALLRSGALSPGDLVKDGPSWISISDFVPLEDTASEMQSGLGGWAARYRAMPAQTRTYLVLGAVGSLVVVAILVAVALLRS
jgi:hypothetical protein